MRLAGGCLVDELSGSRFYAQIDVSFFGINIVSLFHDFVDYLAVSVCVL